MQKRHLLEIEPRVFKYTTAPSNVSPFLNQPYKWHMLDKIKILKISLHSEDAQFSWKREQLAIEKCNNTEQRMKFVIHWNNEVVV